MKKIKSTVFVGTMILGLVACKKEVIIEPNVSSDIENSNVAEEVRVQNNQADLNELPTQVAQFIQKYYSDSTVASYEIKTVPVIGKSYEIKLNNGVEIDFDDQGNWHEIKDARGIAAELLPQNIQKYVEQNYQATFVTKIEKEKNKYQVELANDLDLEFDLSGHFLRIDK